MTTFNYNEGNDNKYFSEQLRKELEDNSNAGNKQPVMEGVSEQAKTMEYLTE